MSINLVLLSEREREIESERKKEKSEREGALRSRFYANDTKEYKTEQRNIITHLIYWDLSPNPL